jgi:hypothetical protein
MTYFSDYSPYAYGHEAHPGVVHVGWLDNAHPYPQGTVDARLIEKMKLLASNPVELYRGKHICELCAEPPDLVKTMLPDRVVLDPNCSWARWVSQRSSNGEIRVSGEGIVFAAPVLIVHYIEAHGYLPPAQFLKAIEYRLALRMIDTVSCRAYLFRSGVGSLFF